MCYWKITLWTVGLLAFYLYYTFGGDTRLLKNPNYKDLSFACLLGGLGCLMVLLWKAWRKPRWIQLYEAKGLRWASGFSTKEKTWDEMTEVHVHTKMLFNPRVDNTRARTTNQIVTIRFRDGTKLRAASIEVVGYAEFLKTVLDKRESLSRHVEHDLRQTPLPRGQAHRPVQQADETYGPITVHHNGLSWDGQFTPWSQIESYQVMHGMLLISASDGREFLRRTLEVGDWQAVVRVLQLRVTSPAPASR
jgi:hypothetical protein